jgi:hypothetical protein
VIGTGRAGRGVRRQGRWLLALAATLVALSIAELTCRATGAFPPDPITWPGEFPNRPSDVFIADADLGWRIRAGARFDWKTEGRAYPFAAGPDGFRVDERGTEQPDPSLPVVAFVGDSFTFGIGVAWDETFAAQCCARLRARPENLGMPGFAVDQMAMTLEHEALARKPALVVVTFILEDLQRSLQSFRASAGFNKPAFRLEGGELVERTERDRPGALWQFIDAHSHLNAAVRGAMRRLGRRFGIGEWWDVNAACLQRAAVACARARVPLLIVHLPQRGRLDPFPALDEWCIRERVPFLDIARIWKKPPDDAYFREDRHLNAVGHARVAELLAQEIAARWPALAR